MVNDLDGRIGIGCWTFRLLRAGNSNGLQCGGHCCARRHADKCASLHRSPMRHFDRSCDLSTSLDRSVVLMVAPTQHPFPIYTVCENALAEKSAASHLSTAFSEAETRMLTSRVSTRGERHETESKPEILQRSHASD